jgi:hypothetical protein
LRGHFIFAIGWRALAGAQENIPESCIPTIRPVPVSISISISILTAITITVPVFVSWRCGCGLNLPNRRGLWLRRGYAHGADNIQRF